MKSTVANPRNIRIEGPKYRCAKEYGYGDYYIAVGPIERGADCECELDYISMVKGVKPSKRELRNLYARAARAQDRS